MADRSSRNKNECSRFDHMSIDELEEVLRLDYQLPDGQGLDGDTIVHILDVMASREPATAQSPYPDAAVAWNDFLTQYYPAGFCCLPEYTGNDNDAPDQNPRQVQPPSICRRPRSGRTVRTVNVAAILVALLFAMTFTAYALSHDLWKAVARWSQETFFFAAEEDTQLSNGTAQSSESNSASFSSLREALDNYGLTTISIPTWIPERFTLDSVVANEMPSFIDCGVFYECGDDILLISVLFHKEPPQNYALWQKDEVTPVPYEAGGITHYLTTNMGRPSAIWLTGTCECGITGDISEEELLTMIDSSYEGSK